MECWPRWANPDNSKAEQYKGWPKTITLWDNYARMAVEYLPYVNYTGLKSPPVIQVVDEATNETVYTVRIKESGFLPKVFDKGIYSISLGEPGTDQMKVLSNVYSAINPSDTIKVGF